MISQLRSTDIANSLPPIVMQQEDNATINGGTILEKTYNDNSKDLAVYNPKQNTYTIQGITSNAKVWLLHANTAGSWSKGNLFNATNNPSFSGFSTTPSVGFHNCIFGTGGQYEITF